MKINMFVVSLLALVKTLVVTFGLFFVLLLVFNDTLDSLGRGEEIFVYIFIGLFLYSLACVGYVFAILLPLYYIDRENFTQLSASEGIQHHMPVISLIILLFAGLAALIAGVDGLSEGLVQANFFNTFVMAFSGLIFFEYQVRSAMQKQKDVPRAFQQP